jgi:hypothetical protein
MDLCHRKKWVTLVLLSANDWLSEFYRLGEYITYNNLNFDHG